MSACILTKQNNGACCRAQALLEMIDVGTMQFSENHLLELALKAKFYRVCQFVYDKRRQFHKIVDCYLLDDGRQREVRPLCPR